MFAECFIDTLATETGRGLLRPFFVGRIHNCWASADNLGQQDYQSKSFM